MIRSKTFYGETEDEALSKIDIPDDKIITIIPETEVKRSYYDEDIEDDLTFYIKVYYKE